MLSAASSSYRSISGRSKSRVIPAARRSTAWSRRGETGSTFPFTLKDWKRPDLHRVLYERVHRLANEDLSGRKQPVRAAWPGDDGVPGHKHLAGRSPTRDDFAHVDADPHLEPDPELHFELAVQLVEALEHLVGSPDGPKGIVLVDGRHAEDRHYRVPDELFDRSPVARDDHSHLLEVAGHHAPKQLSPAARRAPSIPRHRRRGS